jgi:hypothetical protein
MCRTLPPCRHYLVIPGASVHDKKSGSLEWSTQALIASHELGEQPTRPNVSSPGRGHSGSGSTRHLMTPHTAVRRYGTHPP